MQYALINNSDEIIRIQDFSETPPVLAEAKGLTWLLYQTTTESTNNETHSTSVSVDRENGVVTQTYYESLPANKAQRLSMLSAQTYAHIASKMPDWRLNRWKSYWYLTQKVNNELILTDLEQAEYDAFPDPTETHVQCQEYVPLALQWVIDCINYHKTVGIAISQAATQEELDSITVSYPEFPI